VSDAELAEVGQPILAAAGFQPALACRKELFAEGKSRLKGGCGQDWPPHNWQRRILQVLLEVCATGACLVFIPRS
jgi:hypothetical protein